MLYDVLKREAKEAIVEALQYGDVENYDELHDTVFNTNWYQFRDPANKETQEWAKEILGDDTFDAIGRIYQYEKDNFGEVYTDLSNPAKVLNMLYYIAGEEVIWSADVLYDILDETNKPTDDLNHKLIEEYRRLAL